MVLGVATDIPVTFFTCGRLDTDLVTDLQDTAILLTGIDNAPQVFSTSYTTPEDMVSPNAAM